MILLMCSVICIGSFAAQEKKIISSFKTIIDDVGEFLSTAPIVLVTKDFPTSPSGTISYQLKFEKIRIESYDIRKDDSIITPYTGYMVISLRVLSNLARADVISLDFLRGYSNVEDAKKVMEFMCGNVLTLQHSQPERCIGDIKVLYGYQDDKWVLKGVITDTTNSIPRRTLRDDIARIFLYNSTWKKVFSGKR